MILDYYSLTQLQILRFVRGRQGATAASIIQRCPVPIEVHDRAESAKENAIRGLILSGDLIGPDTEACYHLTPSAETMFDQIDLIRKAERDWPLDKILPIAEKLAGDLRQFAVRVEIAGSIRRRKETCGDIELCAEAIDSRLRDALKAFSEVTIKFGDKYTQTVLVTSDGPVKVDLFETAVPEKWGMLYFIRTGSADFVRRALAHWKTLSAGGECRENILYRGDGAMVQTFDETAVFAALHCPYVPPEKRLPKP